ncbi:MAG: hypothetical protein U0T84_03980 [Chitinophagales bacterium]
MRQLLCLATAALFLAACNSPDAWKKIDVSALNAPLHTMRFERDLFAYDTLHAQESEQQLEQRYGSFYQDYCTGIMAFGAPANRYDTLKGNRDADLRRFLSNPSDRALYDSVQLHFPDIKTQEAAIQQGLKHFRHYFPNKKAPQVIYTFISEFGNGAITYGDTILGIGLDMYLGRNFTMYDGVGFPDFMRRKLEPAYITPNAMEVLYSNYFDQTAYNADKPLIEAMISEGKKYYFMECMLPDAPDSLLIGYTSAQITWCRKSEKSIWQFFNEQDLLYKVNFMEQKRFTGDGPTTPSMPPESPGRVGSWVGWQMVRKYMRDARGQVSLQDLLEKKTAKEIIAKAGYKPK